MTLRNTFVLALLALLATPAGAQAISAGGNSSFAPDASGRLLAWGRNSTGQLGTGLRTSSTAPSGAPTPVRLPTGVDSLTFRWTSVQAGLSHTLAQGSDGRLYGWGLNRWGQLGVGTSLDTILVARAVLLPEDAPAGFTFVSYAIGSSHSVAVGSDGRLFAWGNNENGTLGNGTRDAFPNIYGNTRPVAVATQPDVAAWRAAFAGGSRSFGVAADGQLFAWGNNIQGGLGADTTGNGLRPRLVPTLVSLEAGPADWTGVWVGSDWALGRTADGQLWAWGPNGDGQHGNGTTTGTVRPTPVGRPAGVNTWTDAAGGANHALALADDGRLYAWGGNGNGQLGIGAASATPTTAPVPVVVPAGAGAFTRVSAASHNLAVGAGGQVYAWGFNSRGQLGQGATNTTSLATPTLVAGAFVVAGEATTAAGPDAPAVAVWPSPVQRAATVRYTLGAAGAARVSVLDVLGREVALLADGPAASGAHEARLDAAGLAPGLYVVRVAAGGTVAVRTVVVVR